jgi:hypothetical protein
VFSTTFRDIHTALYGVARRKLRLSGASLAFGGKCGGRGEVRAARGPTDRCCQRDQREFFTIGGMSRLGNIQGLPVRIAAKKTPQGTWESEVEIQLSPQNGVTFSGDRGYATEEEAEEGAWTLAELRVRERLGKRGGA